MILGSQITVPTFSSQWVLFTLSCRCLMICVGFRATGAANARESVLWAKNTRCPIESTYCTYTPLIRGNNEFFFSKLAIQTQTRACWRARFLARTINLVQPHGPRCARQQSDPQDGHIPYKDSGLPFSVSSRLDPHVHTFI